MLGQFLEFSIGTQDVAAAVDFYRSLGFEPVQVGDLPGSASAALCDRDIAIALYGTTADAVVPTFVRPSLKEHLRGVRRLGITLDHARLGADEFHEAAFADPNGLQIRLIEARTFSPGVWNERNVSICGRFIELSVATDSIASSSAWWIALGFEVIAAGESPRPWQRLRGHGLRIGLHRSAPFRAGLTFHCDGLEARIEYLRAKRLEVKRGAPFCDRERGSATLLAPDRTALYLLEAEDTQDLSSGA